MKHLSTAPTSATGGVASAIRHTLSNGIVVLIQRNPGTPTVALHGLVQVGAVNEQAPQAGLAMFTAAALNRGTQNRTFQQIVAETEERGCSVNASGSLHETHFHARMLSEDLSLVLDILADILTRPTFPTREVETLRGQVLMYLREMEQEPGAQAGRAARSLLYPPHHPYSQPMEGTMETIQSITTDDLAAFQHYYHPAITTIAIVGDVQPDALIAQLERAFGNWNPTTPPPEQDIPVVSPLTSRQRRDIPMPGKVQSEIIWSVHGLKRNDPAFYAAKVGDIILGHLGMGGRLGDNIREKQGLAYHIHSSLQAGPYPGPWAAFAGVNPADVERAIEAILYEVDRFRNAGPTEEELSDAKAFLTGILVIGMESNSGIASKLLNIEQYDLGLDYIERYPGLINSVTHEDIVAVAQRYLSTDQCILAVAGPAIPPR